MHRLGQFSQVEEHAVGLYTDVLAFVIAVVGLALGMDEFGALSLR